MNKNKIYTVTITEQGKKGEGIAYIQDKPIYIPNTLPTEKVSIKLIKIEKRRAFGKLLSINTVSEHRVTPPCTISAQCGGCQLQHQDQKSQLNFKENLLKLRLSRFISIKQKVIRPISYSKQEWNFRNKMQFAFGINETTRQLEIGLYAKRSHHIINVTQCPIALDSINLVLNNVKKWHQKYPLSIFNEKTGTGSLRYLTIRHSKTTNETMIILTVASKNIQLESFITTMKELASVTSIYSCIQANPSKDTVLENNMTCIWGKKTIQEKLFNVTCNVSPLSFLQANSLLVNQLYQHVVDIIKEKKPTHILDIYCGTGILTIALAKQHAQVTGIDYNKAAIQDAIKNAQLNNVNPSFICNKAETFLKDHNCNNDFVILDPPRKGCHKSVLDALLTYKPTSICYISCNPDTLGKDLRELTKSYSISFIQPVDMFCHTPHLETVVLLSLKTLAQPYQ